MESKKYQKIVDRHQPKEPKTFNLLAAFITGGIIGLLANLLIDVYTYYFHIPTKTAGTYMLITFNFLACLITAIGVFDNLVKKGKMGFIIPITGFAHSMQSAALEYKKEGLVTGVGTNIFKLAGTVIMFGIVSAYVFGIVRALVFGG